MMQASLVNGEKICTKLAQERNCYQISAGTWIHHFTNLCVSTWYQNFGKPFSATKEISSIIISPYSEIQSHVNDFIYGLFIPSQLLRECSLEGLNLKLLLWTLTLQVFFLKESTIENISCNFKSP